jgi:hypothetical protein
LRAVALRALARPASCHLISRRAAALPALVERSDDGKLSRDKAQQEAIRLMIEMKADGKSLRGAAAIAAQGFKISHTGVAGILNARIRRVESRDATSASGGGRSQSPRQNGPTATPATTMTAASRRRRRGDWRAPDVIEVSGRGGKKSVPSAGCGEAKNRVSSAGRPNPTPVFEPAPLCGNRGALPEWLRSSRDHSAAGRRRPAVIA